jgi:hypothetical protein
MGISWFESLDKLPIFDNKRWEIQKTGRSRTETIFYLASYGPEDVGPLNTLIKLHWVQSDWMPCVLPAWFCGGCWTDVGGVLLRKTNLLQYGTCN